MRASSPSVLAAVALTCSCAAPGQFTRPEELDAIAREAVPEAKARKVVSVAEWELQGPLPERVEHAPLADTSAPFTQAVLQGAAGRFPLTEDLTCIARERARFALAHDGAAPGVLLREFIDARCGCPTRLIQTWELFGDVPDDVSEAELAKRWGPDVVSQLHAVPDGAPAGVAVVREAGRARLTLAFAIDQSRIEPLSIYPEGGVVRVRGTLQRPAEEVWGRINQGADTSAPCVKNPEVRLPNFELACPVQGGNPHDWLAVWAREPGRFLGYAVFSTMVWQQGAATSRFVRPAVGAARDGSPQAFLEALNDQRVKLGREPVVLSSPQSEQARGLVPPYVAAQLNGDHARLDRIAMGLIAGWRVEGAITEGQFTSNEVPSEAASELLALMLELPGGRHQLLARETRVIALGQVDHGGLVDTLVCTYSLLDEPEPTVARQQQLIDRLNAERARRGLPAAQWVRLPTKTADEVAAEVRAKGLEPHDGLERLMTDAVQVIKKPVRGWQFFASSLDEVTWPDELIARPTLQVTLTIAPYKRKDTPWTQYVFLVVLFEGASTTQA